MTAESRRLLGLGLLAGAAGIVLLMLVWLASSGVEAGGFVLGLLLTFMLAGPLAAGGLFVLVQSRQDQTLEDRFASKRRILDADRLFRQELHNRLLQLAQTPGLPGPELRQVAAAVQRASFDDVAWYDAIQLDDSQVPLLRHYDDLVWERVRWMSDHPFDSSDTLRELQQAIDQRGDLLVRGRTGPAVAPAALLQAAPPASLPQLALGDALTVDSIDYLVDAVATLFAEGQISRLHHLVPSGGGGAEHWLFVSPGGLQLALLDALPGIHTTGAAQLTYRDTALKLSSSQSQTVSVQTSELSTPDVLVRVWTYASGSLVARVEQWPDGAIHAYAGELIQPRHIEVWPAARQLEVAKSPGQS